MPIFAKDVFQTDARGFSALLTCSGAGALTSAAQLAVSEICVIRQATSGRRDFVLCVRGRFRVGAEFNFGLRLALMSGYFLLTFLTTANTLVQTLAPDELRGRVFSVYSMALIGSGHSARSSLAAWPKRSILESRFSRARASPRPGRLARFANAARCGNNNLSSTKEGNKKAAKTRKSCFRRFD
jgi:hypothetical protein